MPTSATSTVLNFGNGGIYSTNVGGPTISNAEPIRIATITEASANYTKKGVGLKGNYEFFEDMASADAELKGDFTTGRLDANALNQMLFADQYAAGANLLRDFKDTYTASAVGSPPTAGTFTVAPPNSGTWVSDLGLWYATPTNNNSFSQLQFLSSGTPSQGQYTVSNGEYTVSVADAGKSFIVSYVYSITGGHTLSITNQLMGNNRPVVKLYFAMPYSGDNDLIVNTARITGMMIPEKRDDYTYYKFSWEAYGVGTVFQFCESV